MFLPVAAVLLAASLSVVASPATPPSKSPVKTGAQEPKGKALDGFGPAGIRLVEQRSERFLLQGKTRWPLADGCSENQGSNTTIVVDANGDGTADLVTVREEYSGAGAYGAVSYFKTCAWGWTPEGPVRIATLELEEMASLGLKKPEDIRRYLKDAPTAADTERTVPVQLLSVTDPHTRSWQVGTDRVHLTFNGLYTLAVTRETAGKKTSISHHYSIDASMLDGAIRPWDLEGVWEERRQYGQPICCAMNWNHPKSPQITGAWARGTTTYVQLEQGQSEYFARCQQLLLTPSGQGAKHACRELPAKP